MQHGCLIFSLLCSKYTLSSILCWAYDDGVAVLDCDPICHAEIGLISLNCKRVNQHQAVIGAGTMHLAFQSNGQFGR